MIQQENNIQFNKSNLQNKWNIELKLSKNALNNIKLSFKGKELNTAQSWDFNLNEIDKVKKLK